MDKTKTLFLTSSILETLPEIVKYIEKPVTGQKLAFINTASEVEGGMRTWIYDDLAFFEKLGFNAFSYTITDKTYEQISKDLSDIDILFVAGGNVFYLMDKVHKSGFKEFVTNHLNAGKIYIGESSGTLITAPDLSIAHRQEALDKVPGFSDFTGMGIVDFTVFPHWGSDQNRNMYLHDRMEHAYVTHHKIILLTDKQFVMVKGDWIKILEVQTQ